MTPFQVFLAIAGFAVVLFTILAVVVSFKEYRRRKAQRERDEFMARLGFRRIR